jgi:hypothetical protein
MELFIFVAVVVLVLAVLRHFVFKKNTHNKPSIGGGSGDDSDADSEHREK